MSEESSSSAKDIPEQSSTRYRDDSGTKVKLVMRETKVYDKNGVISRSREYLISHKQKSSMEKHVVMTDVCTKIIVIVIAIIIGIGLGIMMS